MGDTILDRAVRLWQKAGLAYIYPVYAVPQPEAYEVTQRIANEYAGYFDDELFQLLSSSSPVVVAHVLSIMRSTGRLALDKLPSHVLADERVVTIAGCFLCQTTVGELARKFVEEAQLDHEKNG